MDKCLLTVEVEVLEQKNPEIEEEYLTLLCLAKVKKRPCLL